MKEEVEVKTSNNYFEEHSRNVFIMKSDLPLLKDSFLPTVPWQDDHFC